MAGSSLEEGVRIQQSGFRIELFNIFTENFQLNPLFPIHFHRSKLTQYFHTTNNLTNHKF